MISQPGSHRIASPTLESVWSLFSREFGRWYSHVIKVLATFEVARFATRPQNLKFDFFFFLKKKRAWCIYVRKLTLFVSIFEVICN